MQNSIAYQSLVYQSQSLRLPHFFRIPQEQNLAQNTSQNYSNQDVNKGISSANGRQTGFKNPIDRGLKVLAHELDRQFFSQGDAGFFKSESLQKSVSISYQPPSAEQVAKTVLNFIARRIRSEKANGASSERLTKLLTAAREGVKTGFSQAREQISSLGLNSDSLSSKISDSFTRINKGIDRLEKKVTSYELNQPSVQNLPKPLVINKQKQSSGAESFSALSQTANISIKTQDGDVITIDIKNLRALYQSLGYQPVSHGTGSSFSSISLRSESLQSSSFNLSVKGSLDKQELKAVDSLLKKIGHLATQFFGGDFQRAFKSALGLGFNSKEIASLSLNFSQTQIQSISTYKDIASLGKDSTSLAQVRPTLDAVTAFTEKLSGLVQQSRNIGLPEKSPVNILNQLLDKTKNQETNAQFLKILDEQQQFLGVLNKHFSRPTSIQKTAVTG